MSAALVVIGTSWGGLRALQQLLGDLGRPLPCPVIVAQHRGPDDGDLAGLLRRETGQAVIDAEDKTEMAPGTVYLAPADYHVLVEARGQIALSTMPPVLSARPSIDVLFESAADVYGPDVVGVVLTGASADGAAGLRRIHADGGTAIVQDPATAECAIMPRAALAATTTAAVSDLQRMAGLVRRLTGGTAA